MPGWSSFWTTNGFLLVVDLVYAFGSVSPISALQGADFDTVDNPTLEVEQELTADHFNRRAGSVSNSTERLVLRLARLEYNNGIEPYGTFRAMDDRSEAARAFRHYVVTEALLGAVDELYDEFGLR